MDYLAQYTDFEHEEKVNLSPVVSYHQDTAYLTVVELPWKSADGVKDTYLEINGDVDTLYVDVRERKWKYNSLKFNGEEAENYLFGQIQDSGQWVEPRWLLPPESVRPDAPKVARHPDDVFSS